ncbi:MAG TPA: MBL fold metallo-hydrolase [Acidobacteriota bacterium]|jgi:glyoxylase-like metal-dependent hydrolase (beta-lactamase superfamily II)
MPEKYLLETRAVPPFYKNGYLLACAQTGETVLIDPGDEVQELAAVADRRNWTVKYILLTHAHMDHITGVDFAKRRYSVPIFLHKDDEFLYTGLAQQGEWFGVRLSAPPPVDKYFSDGGTVEWGKLKAEVIHTPGHSPGGVCLKLDNLVIAGDTLFAGSIGRTDLPGGDATTLIRSIKTRLLPLPDHVIVYSGHGPETTIGQERRTNPYLN